MKITPSTAREVRRLALDVLLLDGETEAAPSLADMARRAKALLDGPLREKRTRVPKPQAPGTTRDDRRQEHRAATGDLRAQVWERCGGRCEVSGAELGSAWELHHVRSAGERRSRQSLDNVLALHPDIHRGLHRGIPSLLLDVKEACIRLGLRDGLRAVEKRIAHMEMVRR